MYGPITARRQNAAPVQRQPGRGHIALQLPVILPLPAALAFELPFLEGDAKAAAHGSRQGCRYLHRALRAGFLSIASQQCGQSQLGLPGGHAQLGVALPAFDSQLSVDARQCTARCHRSACLDLQVTENPLRAKA